MTEFRKHALAAAAAAGLPAMLAALLMALAIGQQNAAVTALSDQQEVLARLRVIASAEATNRRAVTPRDDGVDESLSGNGTGAELSAEIAAAISDIAGRHGLQVVRTTDIAPADHGRLTLFGTSAELLGTMAGILAALQELAARRPLLVFSNLTIRSDAGPGPAATQETMLTVSFEVYGVRQKAAVQPAVPAQ